MVFEQRFSYRGKRHFGYIDDCFPLNKMNEGKVDGKSGFQKSVLNECHIKDARTFRKHFESVGISYSSSSNHMYAKKNGLEFLSPNESGEFSEKLYCYYHNRTAHRSEFIRNDKLASWIVNRWRKMCGCSFNEDLLDEQMPTNPLVKYDYIL